MTIGRWLLLFVHLHVALLSWLVGAVLLLLRVVHSPRWESGVLMTTRRGDTDRSLTFGRFVAFSDAGRASLRVKRHELVHVAQGEDAAAAGLALGAVLAGLLALAGLVTDVAWWLPPALWAVAWWLVPALVAVEYVTAPLRHGVPAGDGSWFARWYRVGATQSQHERSAYAQTDNADWWARHENGGSR